MSNPKPCVQCKYHTKTKIDARATGGFILCHDCHHPLAVDPIDGNSMGQPCKQMRENTGCCGWSGAWFESKVSK